MVVKQDFSPLVVECPIIQERIICEGHSLIYGNKLNYATNKFLQSRKLLSNLFANDCYKILTLYKSNYTTSHKARSHALR